MKCASLIVILTTLSLHACGLRSHGGIVDNGNKPADPAPGPGTRRPPIDPAPVEEKVTLVPVLAQFQISVPERWPVEAEMEESNILRFNGHAILFTPGSGVCAVEPTVNEFDVEIYACSATMTIFDVGYGEFITAKHPERTADIDVVLNSFRRT